METNHSDKNYDYYNDREKENGMICNEMIEHFFYFFVHDISYKKLNVPISTALVITGDVRIILAVCGNLNFKRSEKVWDFQSGAV